MLFTWESGGGGDSIALHEAAPAVAHSRVWWFVGRRYGLRAMDAFLQLGDWVMEWPVEAAAETFAGFLFDAGLLGSGEGAEAAADSIVGVALSLQEHLACAFYAASLQGRFRTVYNQRWAARSATAATGGGGGGLAHKTELGGGRRSPAAWPSTTNDDASAARSRRSGDGGGGVSSAADAKFFVGQRVRSRWMGGRSYYHGYVQRINRPSPHEQQHQQGASSDVAAAAAKRGVTYDIQYDDGDFESGQREELMEPLAEEAVAVVDWQYWDAWIVLGVVAGLAVLSVSVVTIAIVAVVKAARDCLGV